MNLFQKLYDDQLDLTTRRHFMRDCATGLGSMWLALQGHKAMGSPLSIQHDPESPLAPIAPSFAPKAKRVIYIHMIGAPSQYELFVHKPDLIKYNGKDCPSEFLEGQRFAFIKGVPKILGPVYDFKQHGQSGTYISDRMPHLAEHADDLCFIHTMQTDQFNHGPAQLKIHTGNQLLGHPSIGSWVTYGLGSDNDNLPGYMVLLSGGRLPRVGASLWGSGYLPSVYQGVQCRSGGDPILNVQNPQGVSRDIRRRALDALNGVNKATYDQVGDPETLARIAQYEMSYRMQTAVPEVMDIKDEPEYIHELYGTQPGKESFANNCLLARKLVENGVRFVQLFDWGWDSHGSNKTEALNHGFKNKCQQTDKPVAALLTDLKQRGLLEDTLVIWGGEFGRTPMQENRGGMAGNFAGRDHNPNAFSIWMAGAGVKKGFSYGETDMFGYKVVKDPVHTYDFHATLMHLLGYDHEKLSVPFQGLNQKLTGVNKAKVIKGILA
ncbi:hypothetical protein Rhal01_02668 [Rubritalea halochordaticola]|uniref:DUF1501 domain-containing protein n=1 Tax=Rubritalea halochordaticola TaxID=714537 RepID=A0ABP9V1B8_9BACT